MATINGTSNDDTLVGGSSGDYIYAGGGNDVVTSAGSATVIYGGSGNDTITGDGSSNTLRGDSGNDVIIGGGSSNTLWGGTGDDDLTAGGSSNVLYGEAGDDTLDTGESGSSTLAGGAGDDVYQINVTSATNSNQFTTFIDDSDGDDTLDLSGVVDSVSQLSFAGNYSDLFIYVSDNNGNRIGTITVNDHFISNDSYSLETLVVGDQTIALGDNSAQELTSLITYGATDANDTIIGGVGRDTIYGFAGDDVIVASQGNYSRVYGGNGDDDISANGDFQSLYGQAGDDTLSSGDFKSGNLYGGLGDDVYVVEWTSATNNNQYVTSISDENYSWNAGSDILDLSAVAGSIDNISFGGSYSSLIIYVYDDIGDQIGSVTINNHFNSYYDRDIETLIIGDDTLALTGADNGNELNSRLKYGASANADLITVGGDDGTVLGLAGNDTITGGGDGNQLYGGDGNDDITAGGERNYLYGEAGNDTLHTGDNDNVYLYGGLGDDVFVVDWSGASDSDTYYTRIAETAYITDAGSDVLDLSAVASSLDDLTFSGSYTELTISVKDDDGNVIGTVYLDGQYHSYYDRQVEILIVGDDTLDLSAATTGDQLNSIVQYGVSSNDDLIEVAGNNESVYGLGGDDTITSLGTGNSLFGLDGDDHLIAGGDDLLSGGAGNDTLDVNNNDSVILYGGTGDDLYFVSWEGASADDTFSTSISNTYQTANGEDTLDLSAVADTVGNLTFAASGYFDLVIYVNDENGDRIGSVTINGQFHPYSGETIETIILGSETLDISDAVSVGYLNSIYEYGASANDDSIAGETDSEDIYGFGGDDTLTGGGTYTRLFGGNGDDLLTAGAANNSLYGDAGQDMLISGDHTNAYLAGGACDDTYIVNWESADASNYHYATVYESNRYSDAGSNALDLSAVADSLDKLSFGTFSNKLYIYVLDDDGNQIGLVTLDNQFDYYGSSIDTLIVGDETVDLTEYDSAIQLISELEYGASANDDDIVVAASNVSVNTYAGDDTVSVTSINASAYGGVGDDSLSVGGISSRAYGEEGNDVLTATANTTAYLSGGEGDDSLTSASYAGNMYGEEGNDSLTTSSGYQRMYGGVGDDTYFIAWTAANNNSAWIYDNSYSTDGGDDILDLSGVADDFNNISFGASLYGGSDLYVYVKDDDGNTIGTIYIDDHFYTYRDEAVETIRIGDQTFDLTSATSASGLNTLLTTRVGNTAENLTGDSSDDIMYGYGGDDVMNGGAGSDKVSGDRGSDTLYGADGNDLLIGGSQDDMLDGGDGADSLLGGNGNDTVKGGSGNDTLSGSVGADSLHGGGGGDRLFGDAGADTLNGGGGGDRVDYLKDSADLAIDLESGEVSGGFAEGDVLIGIESVFGGKGNDTLKALESGSRLNGAGGDDVIEGRSGDDLLAGGNGSDTLNGGGGDDLMNGNRGDDTLNGGAGDDTLRGSSGTDTFVFSAGGGDDVVVDFRSNDLLDLSDTTTDFIDLSSVAAAATETTEGLLIDLGGGDSLLLEGATLATLTDDNLLI